MPDTGAPWNIPYVASTDLVSDWPADSQDLADAIADGLDAAGGLVEVKSALFTGTQSNSTASGANFAVTDLSITHEVADASNKLIISAFIGRTGDGNVLSTALAVYDGTSFIGAGDADGNRSTVTAGGRLLGSGGTAVGNSLSATFVHTPGSGSKTYTVRALNGASTTQTIYINRISSDSDVVYTTRAASGLVIMEVKV